MPDSFAPITGGTPLPNKPWFFDGFADGNNTFSLATELRPTELYRMYNAELYGKKSVRPRRGGIRLGAAVGTGHIDGLFQYKEGVANEIMAIAGGALKKYNSATSAWDAVTGGSFTSGLRTRGVKLRGNHYFGNGIDDFSRYNGTQVETFTAVAAPTGLAVTPQGTPGTTEYVYTITSVTNKGQSLPATEVVITNGAATLNTTDKNRIVFNRRTESQIIGYNLFGRKRTGNGVTLMKFIDQPASGATITFDDDNAIDPTIWLPPDGDSTDGIKAAIWEQLKGSIVAAGVTTEPHRLFYTGTGDKYESFSPAHNGGWADVREGDNDEGINGLAPFESKIIVAKQNSIHQFYFSLDTGDAVIQELITYTGCGAPGSMVVMENEIAFLDSELRLRILGYEPNYNAAIRTTSLTEGRVQDLYNEVDPAYIKNSEAIYHNGRYYLAVTTQGSTTNNAVLPYDRRYLAHLGKWTGSNCHVGSWIIYDGIDGRKRLYAGSSDSAYVYEFEREGTLTDHDGTAVVPLIRTRQEDLKNSGQQKIWKWADLRLFRISGTIRLTTILDGVNTFDTKPLSSMVDTGWGIAQWGTVQWGVSTGTPPTASDLDATYRKEIYEVANSIQFEITKTGAQDDFILVSMRGEAMLLPPEVFDTSRYI